MMPISNVPPPAAGAKKSSSAAIVRKQSKKEQRIEAVSGLGMLAQVPLLAAKQYADAGAITMHWPNVAKEIAELAETQEVIANVIDPLLKVGPYTGLVTAILPFVMQIAVNHGRVAPGSMGSVPATALTAQVEAGIAQAELQALQMQREAEAQAAEMRARIQREREASTVNETAAV